MFESIGRSITLIKASWEVIKKDHEILLFPFLSGILCIIITITFFIPSFLLDSAFNSRYSHSPLIYVGIFFFYLVIYFIVIFFNSGLVACANIRLTGGDPRFSDGISIAKRHFRSILVWALISATIGLILQIIRGNRGSIVTNIVTSLIGMAWNLLTFFVVPVMIIENRSVRESIKESVALFKRTWGETVVGQAGVSLIFFLIGLAGLIPVILVIFTRIFPLIIAMVSLYVLLLVILFVLANAMQGVFNTALYLYAKNGIVPEGFSKELIENAFAPGNQYYNRGGNI